MPVNHLRLRRLGLLLALAVCGALLLAPPTWADEDEEDPNEGCLVCHGDREEAKGFYIDGARHRRSVHSEIACTDCHSEYETYPHGDDTETEQCAGCHEDAYEALSKGVHSKLWGEDPATSEGSRVCAVCHGLHGIFKADSMESRLWPLTVPRTCGQCHFENTQTFGAPVEQLLKERYIDDTHGHGLLRAGLISAPTCVSCHGGHEILPSTDPASPVHPDNVSRDCGKCHVGILQQYRMSVHGRVERGHADENKNHREPATCTDCHEPHGIRKVDDHFKLRIIKTCSGCHGKRGSTYRGTYHGRITEMGFGGVASCDECHTAHNILPTSDPLSSLHDDNRVQTCAKCHEGSTKEFANYAVHADPEDQEGWPILYWARQVMRTIIFVTWAAWALHLLLWLPGLIRERKHLRASAQPVSGRWYRRWPWSYRALHLTLVFSFLLLALTGLPLRFHNAPWSSVIFGMLGGPESVRLFHRIGAALTFGYAIAFIVMIVWRRVRGEKGMFWGSRTLLPRFKDLQDMKDNIRWSLKGGEPPKWGRWTYYEKFDFLAEVWGVMFIGVTGLVMWFPMFFTGFLPGWAINLAHILHSYEALLATSFIFTMHFFNANLRPGKFPVDTVFLTGRIPEEELRHERPEEYEEMRRDGRLVSEALPPPRRRLVKRARVMGTLLMSIGILLLMLMASTLFL